MISTLPTSLIVLLVISWTQASSYTQIDAEGRKYIMDWHNGLRSQIALGKYVAKTDKKPAATNMAKLKWDATLAKAAQLYADTCPSGHSKNRKDAGENLFYYWPPVNDKEAPQKMCNSSAKCWAGEFQKHGWPSNKLTVTLFQSGIGHATQMAWAKTTKIGCGLGRCNVTEVFGTKRTVVCQYHPRGNVINDDIYESGKTCSNCPKGTKCEAKTGLCV